MATLAAATCVFLTVCISSCLCFSAGPPVDDVRVCDQLWPAGHGPISNQQQGNGGFLIRTNLTLNESMGGFNYLAGESYSIVIVGMQQTFRGFLVQARSIPGNIFIGEFMVQGTMQQTLSCLDPMRNPNNMATITHSNQALQNFNSMSLMWRAPSDSSGVVGIRFSVVAVFRTYYIARNAAQALAPPTTAPAPTTPPTVPQTTPPLPTTAPTTPPVLLYGVTPPSLDPTEYRLTFSSPSGCFRPLCTIFVGISTNLGNSTFLDFYIEARTSTWAGVGFSPTRSMPDADIFACNITASGLVEVLDTWNIPSPNRANRIDSVQDTVLFNATAENGTLTCTFVRSVAGTIVGSEDIDLNNTLYVMYGVGRAAPTANVLLHDVRPNGQPPMLSLQALNVVTDNNILILEMPRDPEEYRLTFRQPPNCNISDCNVFVGIDTNNSTRGYLDFYLEGQSQAWLAVGFSDTANMFLADVLACNFNPNTGQVEVLDAWNLDNTRNNAVDGIQDVILFNSSVINGRISCVFARSVAGSRLGREDLNLNNSYFVMYGLRPTNPLPGRLPAHDFGGGNPVVSGIRVNAVLNNQSDLLITPGNRPIGVIDPQVDPANYRLTFRNPAGCEPSSCDIFVGINTNAGNSQYLDFFLEGQAEAWVAVGFSDTQNMFSSDVLGCNMNPVTQEVEVLDTYNPASPTRSNVIDDTRDQDVFRFESRLQNGRISCSFTRLAVGSDPAPQDLNLKNDAYVMFGARLANPGETNLLAHALGAGNNPMFAAGRINPSISQANVETDNSLPRLIRAHGILMLIAWPLMAVTAIFFAAWMRPALPNGEWFQTHRFLMCGSIFVAVIGFAIIFIANRNGSPIGLINLGSSNRIGTAHFAIGIIVMFLHLLNPLISACRCEPKNSKRWIFNLIHGTFVGMIAELLALANVGIGLAIFSQRLSRFQDYTIFWVYLGYVGIFLLFIITLFFLYTVLAYVSNEEDRSKLAPSLVKPLVSSNTDSVAVKQVDVGVELTIPGVHVEQDIPKPKIPSRDSPIRWLSLFLFMIFVIIFVVVLIIMVGIP